MIWEEAFFWYALGFLSCLALILTMGAIGKFVANREPPDYPLPR